MDTKNLIIIIVILLGGYYYLSINTSLNDLSCQDGSCELEPETPEETEDETEEETKPVEHPNTIDLEPEVVECEEEEPEPESTEVAPKDTESKTNTFNDLFNNNVTQPSEKVYDIDDRTLKADDLLPSTDNEWSKMNNLVSNDMKDKNFLVTRNLGINTVGGSLRNPSYDIRGTPPNPRLGHMPWGNSTIEYDNNTRHMEFVKHKLEKPTDC